jgi:hypothetical protein
MTTLQAPRDHEARVTAPEQPPPFSLRAKTRSIFVVALALFIGLNVVFQLANPFKFDPYRYSYRGWSWWTLEDLKRNSNEYNVALLGSSLMVGAAAGCDANYVKKNLDLTKYHEMGYLNDRMHELFGGKFRTFNLAAPGQMPSDAYLMLKAMASTGNRPDVVIYGVAPRDFIDSTLSAPCDTEPFHYLSRIVSIDDVYAAEFRGFWGKLDWYLQKASFVYNHALDFQLAFKDAAQVFVDRVVPLPWSDHRFTWWDRTQMLPNYLPAEIHAAAVIIAPMGKKDMSFNDNTAEYMARYKKPDIHTFRTQMYFLRKMAEYCHRERIELVLVNMPIMRFNIAMLPPGVYGKYLEVLRQFAWNHNIIYYDLCDFAKYPREDFHDTVHLSHLGARKFFDTLIGRLNHDPRAATALSLSGLQLEKHNALASQHQPF